MLIDDVIHTGCASSAGSLLTVHTLEGRYIAHDEEQFGRLGIDAPKTIGRSWQDYCPANLIDTEQSAVSSVIFSGQPTILDGIVRLWPGRGVSVRGRISLVQTKGRSPAILREGLAVTALSSDDLRRSIDDHHRAIATASAIAAALTTMLQDGAGRLPAEVCAKMRAARDQADRIGQRRLRTLLG